MSEDSSQYVHGYVMFHLPLMRPYRPVSNPPSRETLDAGPASQSHFSVDHLQNTPSLYPGSNDERTDYGQQQQLHLSPARRLHTQTIGPMHSSSACSNGAPTRTDRGTGDATGPPAYGPIDDDKAGGSSGTLMLTEGGRSRYLGPTAGTEWLKEVYYTV